MSHPALATPADSPARDGFAILADALDGAAVDALLAGVAPHAEAGLAWHERH